MRILKAETDGLADIIVPALLLKGYAITTKNPTIQFIFNPGKVKCGSFTGMSPFIKLETVFNLPEDALAINASKIQVLKQNSLWSKDEIDRLNLEAAIKRDKIILTTKIEKALKHLKEYILNLKTV